MAFHLTSLLGDPFLAASCFPDKFLKGAANMQLTYTLHTTFDVCLNLTGSVWLAGGGKDLHVLFDSR